MTTPSSTTITMLVFITLIVWRLYSRIGRMVGQQRLSTARQGIALASYGVVTGLFCLATAAHPERLCWLAVGLALGAPLAIFGLKKTVFERTPDGLFYTPHAHIGIALSLIIVARIGYRFFAAQSFDPAAQPTPNNFGSSPLTLAVFGLLAGYYVTYSIGLLRWRFQVLKDDGQLAASTVEQEPPGA